MTYASAFAGRVNQFCDALEKRLVPDEDGVVSWEKAHSSYRAFEDFKERVPDWDPTGEYGGAFEPWEEACEREGIRAWGAEGPPRPVSLVERVLRERKEALTGADRIYARTMIPAERAHTQALAEAKRVRDEAEASLWRNQEEEIRRLLSEPEKIDRRLVAQSWVAQWEAQMEAKRDAREKSPMPSRPPDDEDGAPAPPALSDDSAALIHLEATIRLRHEKAKARAYRVYARASDRAERAYEQALTGRERTGRTALRARKDWDALVQLAERVTELGQQVERAIGRFAVIDVTMNRDAVLWQKEGVKEYLGLPKGPAPPRPPVGPRDPAIAAWVKRQRALGREPKQIHRLLKDKAAKAGVKPISLSTIYRWLKDA